MSSIARFRIVDQAELEALINKPFAVPPKAGFWKTLFGTKEPSPQKVFVDEFYAVGKEVEVFEYSGYAFPSLEIFLEERFDINVSDHQDADFTRSLEERIGPSQAFASTGAANLLHLLSSVTLSRSDLEKYADEEYGEDQGVMVEALESAFNSLKVWLGQVKPGEIGIIMNG